MHDQRNTPPRSSRPNVPAETTPAFVPTIDVEDIFRKLIEDELRNGRLTRARRKRIIRYAAQLRLSAVQVGRLIEACRRKVLQHSEPDERYHLLHLVEPRPTEVPLVFKVSLVVALAVLFGLLVLKWIG